MNYNNKRSNRILLITIYTSILFIPLFVYPQLAKIGNVDTPHTKERNGLEANLGFTRFGQYFNVGVTRNISTNIYGKFLAGMEFGKFEKKNLKYNSYTFDLGLHYIFLKYRNAFFFSGSGGLSCNLDRLKNIEDDNGNYANYGIFLGLEGEYYFNHHWAMLINGRQKFLFRKEYGTLIFFGGIGAKYMF